MNIKTKIITVIIASILVLPAIFNPRRDGGEVLGVSESATPSVVSVQDTPEVVVVEEPVVEVVEAEPESGGWFQVSNPFSGWFDNERDARESVQPVQQEGVRIRDIGSGIRDVEGITGGVASDQSGVAQVGRAIWEQSATISVISDVYPVGSGIEVTSGGRTLNLVVNKSRVLVPGTLLVVDQQTFIQLGGDPELQSALEVEVRAN